MLSENTESNNDLRKEKVDQFKLNISDNSSNKLEKFKKVKSKKSLVRVKLFNSIWVFMIVSLSIMIGQFFVFGALDMLAMNRNQQVVTVEIPNKSTRSDIANILYKQGVIKNKGFFKFYTVLTRTGNKIIPGKFEIKTNLDYEAIISFLKSNNNRVEEDLINVTIPEGKNILEISDILESNEICEKDAFLKACKSNDFDKEYTFLSSLKNSEKLTYKLEGYLFPDTYKFYKYIKPELVIKKMLSNYVKKITYFNNLDTSEEQKRVEEQAKKIGMSLEEVINLASLIQAEAADANDMYNVSSVLHNRLDTLQNSGINKFGEAGLDLLSIDSTVWYPYRMREKVPENLIKATRIYDTYKNHGLPIGPICNPGLLAIDAALKPNQTDYYYFCHSKDGKAFYAKKMSEHQNNLKLAGLN